VRIHAHVLERGVALRSGTGLKHGTRVCSECAVAAERQRGDAGHFTSASAYSNSAAVLLLRLEAGLIQRAVRCSAGAADVSVFVVEVAADQRLVALAQLAYWRSLQPSRSSTLYPAF
jgi:hypothetical protein